MEHKIQDLATLVTAVYKKYCPIAFGAMTQVEDPDIECRLGSNVDRPWSGVTICTDYCAHAHRDSNNMKGGCSAIATLTKHHQDPTDEQYHTLPLYLLKEQDETSEAYHKKVQSGALEILTK